MAPKQPKGSSEAEPAAKKAKAEEPVKAEEPKEPKYEEPDAAKDSRPTLKEKIGFATAETSLNVIPTVGGKVLNCLTDGGMSCLLAGARANVGQKTGRYMFETKILQVTDPHHGQLKTARLALRVGFSTSGSSLLVGEDASSIYFDSEGFCVAAKKRINMTLGKFGKGQVVAVVLNLDSKSPNFNTVALFRDGVAIGDPVPLPDDLKDKALFPHLTYRKASVQVNFGPAALKELPFKCRLLQDAASSDVSVTASKEPKDGKYEVIMPVAFPDEGTFEWLDAFMEKNPQYVELSDRKIMEWARASGQQQHMQQGNKSALSRDKPAFNFGIREMDDMSIRKLIGAVAPVVPRNYLIMEVKSNLVAAERKELLKKFNYPCYKKTAKVMIGEPNKEYKSMVQTKILKDKQAKSDQAFNAKKAEVARKKAAAAQQKEREAKKAEAAKKKKEEEEKKKKEAAEKKKAAEEKKEGEEKKEEETKEEPEAVKEEEKKDEPMEEEEMGEPPVVELTDEEKQKNHAPKRGWDLTMQVMNSTFSKFSTPDTDEGFDDIQYEWQKKDAAAEYVKTWVMNKKLTTRIEDIRPGKIFNDKKAEYAKLVKVWKDKLAAFKAGGSKKPNKKTDEEDDVDIFSVADVCDVGQGVPLFDAFSVDDWELLKLRFEFALLILSFKTDCNDPDRAGIPLDHLNFYYQKYYHQGCNPKQYGMEDLKGVIGLIKDVVSIKDGLVHSQLSDDLESLDIFVKLTEEHRRERQRRIDAGDETARLKFLPPVEPKPKPEPKAAVKVAEAKPAQVAAASKGAKGATVPATKGATVPASGKGAAPVTVPAPKGKDDKGKGKDQGKAWGKDQGKAKGKDSGKDKGWGKGGGKDAKGWGKGGGKW